MLKHRLCEISIVCAFPCLSFPSNLTLTIQTSSKITVLYSNSFSSYILHASLYLQQVISFFFCYIRRHKGSLTKNEHQLIVILAFESLCSQTKLGQITTSVTLTSLMKFLIQIREEKKQKENSRCCLVLSSAADGITAKYYCWLSQIVSKNQQTN